MERCYWPLWLCIAQPNSLAMPKRGGRPNRSYYMGLRSRNFLRFIIRANLLDTADHGGSLILVRVRRRGDLDGHDGDTPCNPSQKFLSALGAILPQDQYLTMHADDKVLLQPINFLGRSGRLRWTSGVHWKSSHPGRLVTDVIHGWLCLPKFHRYQTTWTSSRNIFGSSLQQGILLDGGDF